MHADTDKPTHHAEDVAVAAWSQAGGRVIATASTSTQTS